MLKKIKVLKTEKIINNTLSDKLKEKVGHRIPDDFDLSVIGKIDLREAEKIANEDRRPCTQIYGCRTVYIFPRRPRARISGHGARRASWPHTGKYRKEFPALREHDRLLTK